MFKSKPAPEPSADLPEGYDDEASPYFVPANRRTFYTATAKPAFSEVLEHAERMIWREATEQVDREDDERGDPPIDSLTGRPRARDPREYDERRQSKAEHIRRERQEAFVALAAHELRAWESEKTAREMEARTAYDAQYARLYLCGTCQSVQPSTRPRGIMREARTICEPCERLYLAELTASAYANASADTLARIRADLPSIEAS